ncbi:MAG: hypothetical protein GYA60_04500 [Candidatus Methanofastidiosa archaeon]|nr:hypothetical protein [Candidatus Methanofastidiosa archaeon]
MKIYQFWSADTTYFTTSKSIKKAREIGKHNMKSYYDTCKYLGEQPEEIDKSYFIPDELEEITIEWFRHIIKVDNDIMLLDDELYNI